MGNVISLKKVEHVLLNDGIVHLVDKCTMIIALIELVELDTVTNFVLSNLVPLWQTGGIQFSNEQTYWCLSDDRQVIQLGFCNFKGPDRPVTV